jgi:hypothetical protein
MVKEINYADGSGKAPNSVIECRVYIDAYGLVPYGTTFSDADGGASPYILGDGTSGVAISTILCYGKGPLHVDTPGQQVASQISSSA